MSECSSHTLTEKTRYFQSLTNLIDVRHAWLMTNPAVTRAEGSGIFSSAGVPGAKQPAETRFMTGGLVKRVDVGNVDVAGISRRNRALEKRGISADSTVKSSNGNDKTKSTGKAPQSEHPTCVYDITLCYLEQARLHRASRSTARTTGLGSVGQPRLGR